MSSQLTLVEKERLLKLAKSFRVESITPTLPSISVVEQREDLPLSFAQQRLWFLAQIGASQAYHISNGWRLKGQLDRGALLRALDQIVARHEALRTTFVAIESQPVQRIAAAEESQFHLLEHDLIGAPQIELDRLAREEAASEFDLEVGPLIRGRLIRLAEEEHALLITMHHIVSDGWSMGVFIRELSALYGAYVRGEQDPLPELEVQYADYAVWQRQWMEGEVLRKQAEYWERTLAGAPTLLELPTDHPRPVEQEYAGGWVRIVLGEDLTRRLKELSRRHGATLYMTLLAGWGALLARLSGQEDLVTGTAVANRGRTEIEGLIGLFVNTLALRLDISGSPSVAELLERVKKQVLAAQQHQDIPFEQVVEIARPVRSLSHSPLFQMMLDWDQSVGGGGGRLTMPGLELGPLGVGSDVVAKLDMTLFLRDAGTQIVGGVVYATSLFDAATVERYLGYLRTLLEAMVTDETQAIERLPLLSEAERQQVLYEWNATEAEYPREKLVHQLFEEQVEKTPDAVAVAYEDTTLSYAELNRRANQLAHHLRELGVGPDERVAICLERSLEMVVGLLAVLKAGGAYVPLDPAYPVERLQYMLEDSAPVVLLTQSHLHELVSSLTADLRTINLDDGAASWQLAAAATPEPAHVGLTPEHLAYVIYTSGSTGRPKGAMVQHRSVVNRLQWMKNVYGLNQQDAVLQKTPFSFDVSVWEFFCPLMCGMRLVMARPDGHRDPGYLSDTIARERITTLHFVPSMLQAFVEGGEWQESSSLARVVCSGEALSGTQVRSFYERAQRGELHNLYGPTEAAVDVTAWPCPRELTETTVPIGKPMANVGIYILDKHGEAVPAGVAGELYIGGVQVGRGYLQRPELTGERFVPDPFRGEGGQRLYRTGDLARWRAEGTIEFLGRNDDQIKIRGYRIELGEIEARLLAHAGVREAVVLAREDRIGDKRLVAYYSGTESNGAGIGAEELRRHVAATLPEYMVPAAYVRLAALPLTPNGKLDRKALPAPEGDAYGARGYEEPQGEAERVLAEIWREVLKLDRVGRHDNFFELGGHSLLVVRVIARLRQMGLEVDVRALFARPRLAELAAEIGAQTTQVEVPANGIGLGCEVITPAMLPLVQLTAEEIERIVAVVPGGAANVQDIYPLAPLQEGILFHHLMESESDPYILSSLYSFDNRHRLERYLEAMQAVIDRHDILRTGVVWEGLAEPVQVVWRKAVLPVEEVVLEAGAGDGAIQLRARYHPQSYRLDVRRAPMLRVAIAHDEEQGRWLMMLLQHHLIGDHTTLEVMQEEIEAYLLGREDRLPMPQPFRNLVAQARLGISAEEHEAYFRELLADVEEPTAPFGLLNVQGDGTGIAQSQMRVEAGLARRIRERARKLGVSAASLCHVAWAQVAARTSGRDDVVFGTVLFGRMQGGEGADRALGMFINTLPVRMRVGEQGAEESVREAHRQLAGLMRHEHASLALAQRCSGVPAPAPLFTSLFNYRYRASSGQVNSEEKARAWEGIREFYGEERTNYPLNIAANDLGEGFSLTTQADASIDAHRVCEYMHRALESLVEALESEPSRPLRRLEVIPEAEKRQILYEWNATEAEYPREKLVHQLFEEQVEKTPDAVAVVYEDATLSYRELNRRANQLAHYLREFGVGPDERVAICMERSLEMVVGLLGVLKAGGAYVPLDPAYPTERLQYMLEDSAPVVLLTQDHLHGLLKDVADNVVVVSLGAGTSIWESQSESNPDSISSGLTPEHLAYVIYTSGSTGRPKGAMVQHRSVVNRLEWMKNVYGLNQEDAVLQKTPFSFDVSVWEFFCPLMCGMRLVMARPDGHRDPGYLSDTIARERITTLHFVPSMLQAFVEGGEWQESSSLARVVCSGEALSGTQVRSFYERARAGELHNLYGPTEAAVDVTAWRCPRELTEMTVPIGKPMANVGIYILDKHGEAVPAGVAGELYIGGVQVGRGYLRRPELTGERFVPDPFRGEGGRRLYRTGDLARWRAEGTIEFLGRNDDQIKIRGYRIELGEIEAQLQEHAGVREAVVLAREDRVGDKRLVAYYSVAESHGAGGPGAEELRRHVAATLPEYMVPAAYVRLAELPLTPNGKLDRKALPAPEGDAYGARGYEEPIGKIETTVAEIWREVLKLDRVGRHDNFFELGAHSLLVIRVVSRLRKALNVDVTIRDVFDHPVLADQAAEVQKATPATLPPITPAQRGERLPLSFAQQRLWFLAQMGESEAYHIFNGWRLKGQLDRSALLRALDQIVARHEALRTTFVAIESQPIQRIATAEESQFHLLEHDLIGATEAQAELDWLVREEAATKFDLEAGPLIRGRLIRLAEEEHALLITMHHIVSDGWSMGVFIRELSALYGVYVRGEQDTLAELEVQYADYAVWQRRWMEGELLRQQAEYWERTLAGAPTLLELPTDHPRPAEQDHAGGWVRIVLDENLTRRLKELSRRHGATLYMTLLAGWGALLARLSGQEDLVTGTAVANRSRTEIEGLIGLFVNRLAVRLDVSGSPSVAELLKRVKEQTLAAQQHQDIPFEQVVEIARPVRSLSHSPLFQVVFDWEQNAGGGGGLAMPGLEFGPLGAASDVVAKFDLGLILREAGARIVGGLVYARALFERPTVERYLGYLQTLLEAMVTDEMQAIERLPLLSEAERQQVLYEWNATEAEYPREKLVHQLFEEQVEKTPDAVAVVYEDATLSYSELNRRANQLAHHLRELGVGPDERVAICAQRGLEMIVGLLGVLKAGGAYVPLDPAYLVGRLRYMLEDSTPLVLLTERRWQEVFSGVGEKLAVVELDGPAQSWHKQPATNPQPADVGLTPEHLAYVIYTSASTGTAKGVMVEHRQVINYVAAISNKLGVEEGWSYGLMSTFAADLGHTVMYSSLLRGGALHVVPRAESMDGKRFGRYCQERKIDCVKITPTHFQALLGEDGGEECIPAKCLVFGGETLWPELVTRVKSLRPACRTYNHYGPTECTVGALSEEVEIRREMDGRGIPLGRPLGNTRVYVLDGTGEPAPVGVVGEIYIAGEGVARGYLNRAEVTGERFVSDRFAEAGKARMYMTGDLGRWLGDGTIEFVGRNDFQVKVRGYRVEPGEIEACLKEHEGVREAVVLARADASGDKRLVAYYTSTEANEEASESLGVESLRRHVSAKLPEYMVPAAYVKLEKLPLTPNGKLDRKALPEPKEDAYGAARDYEEPIGEIEWTVAKIWADVLKVERVGRLDNFFELGGHSLLSVRVIANMRRAGLEVDLQTLFATPTLAELAAGMEKMKEIIL
jgi:amino acid adenylation domain-containing protein